MPQRCHAEGLRHCQRGPSALRNQRLNAAVLKYSQLTSFKSSQVTFEQAKPINRSVSRLTVSLLVRTSVRRIAFSHGHGFQVRD